MLIKSWEREDILFVYHYRCETDGKGGMYGSNDDDNDGNDKGII